MNIRKKDILYLILKYFKNLNNKTIFLKLKLNFSIFVKTWVQQKKLTWTFPQPRFFNKFFTTAFISFTQSPENFISFSKNSLPSHYSKNKKVHHMNLSHHFTEAYLPWFSFSWCFYYTEKKEFNIHIRHMMEEKTLRGIWRKADGYNTVINYKKET